ncbi:BamA/TamA family outer membrane protein [Candidatus Zixiibacteriota bacterium]
MLISTESACGQDTWFGQNKVQYRNFEWSVFHTEHFDFYYHQGGEEIAEFAAVSAEHAYEELRYEFHFDLSHRIPIILYNSHNDFQQTNVIPNILQEGIGGFTEYLKHRVVVPFQGSYEDFRHVLHHELVHAVSMAMLYGTGVAALINQAQSGRLPLWFSEGLAEYGAMGWDMEAETFMRDAVISEYLPPLEDIYGGLLAYKGGQAFFHYLAETYGRRRIGELLTSLRLLGNLDQAFIVTLGRPVEDISQEWHRYMKRTYWPQIENRSLPADFAEQLTYHDEDGSTYNVFPALSPEGDRVAFISNRRQYMDLYIISTLDGSVLARLGKGEQVSQFEEMHILRGGVAWSPDGTQLAIAAKGGSRDRMYIMDAGTGRVIREIDPGMDGVFSPAWNSDGRRIAFAGIREGFSDLYLFDLDDSSLTRLTHTRAFESAPSWSSDGAKLAFVSDDIMPGQAASVIDLPVEYGPENIWVLDIDGEVSEPWPVVTSPYADTSPNWGPDDTSLIFLSYRSGIRNLYEKDLQSGEIRPLSNTLNGFESAHYSVTGNQLVFSALNGAGYDIFMMQDPRHTGVTTEPAPTPMAVALERERLETEARAASRSEQLLSSISRDYSRVRFRPIDSGYGSGSRAGEQDFEPERDLGYGVLASSERPYRLKMTPDLVTANAGYSSYWGMAGSSYLEMSDILGNHQLSMMVNLWSTLDNSNYQFTYRNLGHRLNFGISFFWFNYFYLPDRDSRAIYGDRTAGTVALMSYPFSRFLRFDLELSYVGIFRKIYLTGPAERSRRQVILPKASLIGDNTIPGHTGYINGRRYMISLSHSPPGLDHSLRFTTIEADHRTYLRVGREENVVLRLAGGASFGPQPQQFFLGGNGFRWGPRYTSGDLYEIDNMYFSTFQAPLRGFDFYEFSGDRFLLSNVEFRFPMVELLTLGWPLKVMIRNIQGALFCDMGMAWTGADFAPFDTSGKGVAFGNLKSGVGIGARVNLGIFILRMDVAWKNTLRTIGGTPRWHIALGPEF